MLRNSVGNEGRCGVPKQRGCLQIIVLIRVEKTIHRNISCKGQAPTPSGIFSFHTPPSVVVECGRVVLRAVVRSFVVLFWLCRVLCGFVLVV